MPDEPDKPGPHKWMRRNLTSSEFIIGQNETSITCEDDVMDWIAERIEKKSGQAVSVILPNSDTIRLSEFINNNLQSYLDEIVKENPILNSKSYIHLNLKS